MLALAGALWVDEPFAGAMIAVMLASGQLLEARAAARASRELRLLVERTPQTARRLGAGDGVTTCPSSEVIAGDRLLVGTGEVVPVDGRLEAAGTLDESALTGEADQSSGQQATTCAAASSTSARLELLATARAAESTYAGVVRLVEQAQASSAPFVRAADRFAMLFVPLTLVLAGAAWALSGTPLRAVAVLVVATPCPLLLAAPIAIMSGLSRAARIGVVVKGGAALESLAAGQVMLFDKTGTLTQGRPALASIVTATADGDADEVLRLAASLDQVSPHPLASALVTAALSRGLALSMPPRTCKKSTATGSRASSMGTWSAGQGRLDRRVGTTRHGCGGCDGARRSTDRSPSSSPSTAVPAGAFLLEDPLRADAPRMLAMLRCRNLPDGAR